MSKLADIQLAPEGGFRGFGPLGLEGKDPTDAPGLFTQFLSSTVGIITVIAFIWFVFLLLTGAFGLMTAGSDKAQVENARKRITSGVVGLVVVIAAIFLVDLFGTLLGIPNILNPAILLERISP